MTDKSRGRQQFIEDMGDLIDEHGLPHMAGRVIGALIICMPPQMSLDELAEALQASKGSISMTTQLLLRLGIITRVSVPGDRKHYFRIRPQMGQELFLDQTDHIEHHLDIVQKGLEQLKDEPIEAKQRLIEMQVFFEFIQSELPGLVERWTNQREALLEQKLTEHR